MISLAQRITELRTEKGMSRPEPVSYTHLDVYKRQVDVEQRQAEKGALTLVFERMAAVVVVDDGGGGSRLVFLPLPAGDEIVQAYLKVVGQSGDVI